MNEQSRLRRILMSHLRTACLDLSERPARRELIHKSYTKAGKDRQTVMVYTDREGSMAITRVKFRGETVWFALLEIVEGELRVRSGYTDGILRNAGSGDIASWLKHFSEHVNGRKFRRNLMDSIHDFDDEEE